MEKIHQDFTGCKFGTATVCDEQIIFTGKSPRTPTEGKKSPSQRKTTSAISKYLKDYHVDIAHNPAIQQCPKCPQVFTRKNILDMHIKMSHKGDKTTLAEDGTEVKTEESENSEEGIENAENLSENTDNDTESAEKDNNDLLEEEEVQEDTTIDKVDIKEEKIKVEDKVEAKEKIEVEEKVEPPRKRLRRKSPVEKQEDYEGSFYTKEELAVSKLENHHLFYDDSVTCAANADPNEELEKCPDCDRKFVSYFGMMRHFAFLHRPEKTASIMKLKPIPRNTNEIKTK